MPATLKVMVMLLFVGTPETTGTVGGPDGAVTVPLDVEMPALTADIFTPDWLVATDRK